MPSSGRAGRRALQAALEFYISGEVELPGWTRLSNPQALFDFTSPDVHAKGLASWPGRAVRLPEACLSGRAAIRVVPSGTTDEAGEDQD